MQHRIAHTTWSRFLAIAATASATLLMSAPLARAESSVVDVVAVPPSSETENPTAAEPAPPSASAESSASAEPVDTPEPAETEPAETTGGSDTADTETEGGGDPSRPSPNLTSAPESSETAAAVKSSGIGPAAQVPGVVAQTVREVSEQGERIRQATETAAVPIADRGVPTSDLPVQVPPSHPRPPHLTHPAHPLHQIGETLRRASQDLILPPDLGPPTGAGKLLPAGALPEAGPSPKADVEVLPPPAPSGLPGALAPGALPREGAPTSNSLAMLDPADLNGHRPSLLMLVAGGAGGGSVAGVPQPPATAGAPAGGAGRGSESSAPLDGNGPPSSPSPPQVVAPGLGAYSFVPIAALLALLALAAPAILRRLREAPAFPAPTPFVCALERPG